VTRGKGHAPDLATLPIACILSSSQVNRIESRTTPEDHASEQIKQKLEVTYEGTNRRAVSSHGTLHDMKILPAASLAMGWRVVLG
jgi:RimJ/RimL family protein N-acetyltransferase